MAHKGGCGHTCGWCRGLATSHSSHPCAKELLWPCPKAVTLVVLSLPFTEIKADVPWWPSADIHAVLGTSPCLLVCLSVGLVVCLLARPACLLDWLSTSGSAYVLTCCLPVCLLACLPFGLAACLLACLPVGLTVYQVAYLPLDLASCWTVYTCGVLHDSVLYWAPMTVWHVVHAVLSASPHSVPSVGRLLCLCDLLGLCGQAVLLRHWRSCLVLSWDRHQHHFHATCGCHPIFHVFSCCFIF